MFGQDVLNPSATVRTIIEKQGFHEYLKFLSRTNTVYENPAKGTEDSGHTLYYLSKLSESANWNANSLICLAKHKVDGEYDGKWCLTIYCYNAGGSSTYNNAKWAYIDGSLKTISANNKIYWLITMWFDGEALNYTMPESQYYQNDWNFATDLTSETVENAWERGCAPCALSLAQQDYDIFFNKILYDSNSAQLYARNLTTVGDTAWVRPNFKYGMEKEMPNPRNLSAILKEICDRNNLNTYDQFVLFYANPYGTDRTFRSLAVYLNLLKGGSASIDKLCIASGENCFSVGYFKSTSDSANTNQVVIQYPTMTYLALTDNPIYNDSYPMWMYGIGSDGKSRTGRKNARVGVLYAKYSDNTGIDYAHSGSTRTTSSYGIDQYLKLDTYNSSYTALAAPAVRNLFSNQADLYYINGNAYKAIILRYWEYSGQNIREVTGIDIRDNIIMDGFPVGYGLGYSKKKMNISSLLKHIKDVYGQTKLDNVLDYAGVSGMKTLRELIARDEAGNYDDHVSMNVGVLLQRNSNNEIQNFAIWRIRWNGQDISSTYNYKWALYVASSNSYDWYYVLRQGVSTPTAAWETPTYVDIAVSYHTSNLSSGVITNNSWSTDRNHGTPEPSNGLYDLASSPSRTVGLPVFGKKTSQNAATNDANGYEVYWYKDIYEYTSLDDLQADAPIYFRKNLALNGVQPVEGLNLDIFLFKRTRSCVAPAKYRWEKGRFIRVLEEPFAAKAKFYDSFTDELLGTSDLEEAFEIPDEVFEKNRYVKANICTAGNSVLKTIYFLVKFVPEYLTTIVEPTGTYDTKNFNLKNSRYQEFIWSLESEALIPELHITGIDWTHVVFWNETNPNDCYRVNSTDNRVKVPTNLLGFKQNTHCLVSYSDGDDLDVVLSELVWTYY